MNATRTSAHLNQQLTVEKTVTKLTGTQQVPPRTVAQTVPTEDITHKGVSRPDKNNQNHFNQKN